MIHIDYHIRGELAFVVMLLFSILLGRIALVWCSAASGTLLMSASAAGAASVFLASNIHGLSRGDVLCIETGVLLVLVSLASLVWYNTAVRKRKRVATEFQMSLIALLLAFVLFALSGGITHMVIRTTCPPIVPLQADLE